MKNKPVKGMKIGKAVADTTREFSYRFYNTLIKELGHLSTIFLLIVPLLIVCITSDKRVMLILSCVFVLCSHFVKEVGYKLNGETNRGVPIPPLRFTEKDENGIIHINSDYQQEAIVYLCNVEEYLEKRGLIK